MINDRNAMDQLWQHQTELIRSFLELCPKYAKFSEEIAYTIEQEMKQAEIEYSAVTFRAKSLVSFCDKVLRKNYNAPFKKITDLAGVRIVYLYPSDRRSLEDLIERHFKVIEKIDKVDKTDPEHFGYGALHYLVTIGKKSVGARYDELMNLVCEIQVRTILQDAWGIVAHHLSYKQEADVPNELRRKLNALSGLFEMVDEKFDQLRDERQKYRMSIKKQMTENATSFLQQNINLDNLVEFLNWRFPDRKRNKPENVTKLLKELQHFGYTKLEELDRVVRQGYEALKAYEIKFPPHDIESNKKTVYSPVGIIRCVLSLTDENCLNALFYSDEMKDRIRDFRILLIDD